MTFLEALKQVKRRPNQIGLRPVTPPDADTDDESKPFDWRHGSCFSITPPGWLCVLHHGTLRARKDHSPLLVSMSLRYEVLMGEWELVTEGKLNAEWRARYRL